MKATRIYVCLLCLTISFLFGFSPADKKTKATWIWQAELIASEKQEILAFCRQNEVTLIYLRIDMEQPYEHYRQFIRDAAADGIEVHAVGGHPAWALQSYQGNMLKLVKWVKAYNDSAGQAEQIKGIHLDVEPYLLPQWESDQTRVLREWQKNVRTFVAEAKQAGDLQVSAAIAFWLDSIPTPDQPDVPLSKWLIEQFDAICIMAYRDTLEGSNGIVALVEKEMNQADELGKPVLITVNIKRTGLDLESYAEEGAAEMDRQLKLLPSYLGNHPSYAGTAVHDYRNWRMMSATPTVPPAGEHVRGMYVWQAEQLVAEPDEILAFAKQNGVNLLYTRLDLDQPFAVYKDFVRQAHAAGIEVHAMGGHPIWALSENRGRIMRLVKWVQQYNESVSADERFRGIHLDIEPYVMPIWQKNKDEVLRQWMGNIEAFVTETKKDPSLETSVDLAVWLDNSPTPGDAATPFSHWMISQLDHTTLMAFRNHAEGAGGIVAVVKNKIEYASEIDKKLIVAVEMKESHEGHYVSFYEKGRGEMNRQLELAEQLLEKYPAYQGNAVHAYDYWKASRE